MSVPELVEFDMVTVKGEGKGGECSGGGLRVCACLAPCIDFGVVFRDRNLHGAVVRRDATSCDGSAYLRHVVLGCEPVVQGGA